MLWWNFKPACTVFSLFLSIASSLVELKLGVALALTYDYMQSAESAIHRWLVWFMCSGCHWEKAQDKLQHSNCFSSHCTSSFCHWMSYSLCSRYCKSHFSQTSLTLNIVVDLFESYVLTESIAGRKPADCSRPLCQGRSQIFVWGGGGVISFFLFLGRPYGVTGGLIKCSWCFLFFSTRNLRAPSADRRET